MHKLPKANFQVSGSSSSKPELVPLATFKLNYLDNATDIDFVTAVQNSDPKASQLEYYLSDKEGKITNDTPIDINRIDVNLTNKNTRNDYSIENVKYNPETNSLSGISSHSSQYIVNHVQQQRNDKNDKSIKIVALLTQLLVMLTYIIIRLLNMK